MDKNNFSPKEHSPNDTSSTQSSRVQTYSGMISDVAVAGAEAWIRNEHDDESGEGVSSGELGIQSIDLNELAEAAAEHTQVLGDLAGLMLPVPKQMQEATARAVSLVAFEILTNVFDISVSLPNFNTMGFALKRIQAELEELQIKMDKLLRSDYETANHRLEHAMNYLEFTKTHPKAYEEFKKVLDKSNDAFPKHDKFSDKVFIQKLSIFSRFMMHCYSEKLKQFVPLSSLDIEDKQMIANAVFIDLKVVLNEFKKLEIPFYKKFVGQKKKEQKNQDILDSILKVRFF